MGNQGLGMDGNRMNPGPATQCCVTLSKSVTSLSLRFLINNMRSITTPPSAECLEARGWEKHRKGVLAEQDTGLSHDHSLSL